ncbi:hypothetical protein P9112_014174 [Eukaryota sp. TZLM1-RC]
MFQKLLSKLSSPRFRCVAGSDISSVVYAVDSDGKCYSWSDYSSRYLGRKGDPHVPTQIPHFQDVKVVDGTSQTVFVLLSNGLIYNLGRNVQDLTQVYDVDDDEYLDAPALLKTISDVKDIAIADSRFLFLKNDGTVDVYGASDSSDKHSIGAGILGDARPQPQRIPYLNNIVQIATSDSTSAAVSSDGTVYTWGACREGALGHENNTVKSFPFPVHGLSDIAKVDVYDAYFLAVAHDGSVYEWGVKPNDGSCRPEVVPITKVDLPPTRDICVTKQNAFAVTLEGDLFCTGSNYKNRMLISDKDDQATTWPDSWTKPWTKSSIPFKISAVYPVDEAIIVLDEKGRLFGWGEKKMLGIDTDNLPLSERIAQTPIKISSFIKSEPTPIEHVIETSNHVESNQNCISFDDIKANSFYNKIANSFHSTVFVKPDGSVYVFGYGSRGELSFPAKGTSTNSGVPIKVDLPENPFISSVSASPFTVFAIDHSGQAFGWGYNLRKMADSNGEDLGFNGPPSKLNGLSSTTYVNGESDFSVALLDDQKLMLWGKFRNDSFPQNNPTAVELEEFREVVHFACCDKTLIVLKKDGTVEFFGKNGGLFGNGDNEDALKTPCKAKFLDNVAFISASHAKAFFLLKDGTVCYTSSSVTTPVFVPELNNIVYMDCSPSHAMFVDNDGNLFAMGRNDKGQLGLGDHSHRDHPVKVDISDIKYVAAGYSSSILVKADGQVYATGANHNGQLGDGSFGNSAVFKAIGVNLLDNEPPKELPKPGELPELGDFELPPLEKPTFQFGISNQWGYYYDNETLRMWGKQYLPSPFASDYRCEGSKTPVVIENMEHHEPSPHIDGAYNVENIPIAENPLKIVDFGHASGVVITEKDEMFVVGRFSTDSPRQNLVRDVFQLDHIHSLSVGESHVLLLRKDGKVFSFGIGEEGQLGDGSNTWRESAVHVGIPERIAAVHATKQNSFAITVDGELYGWGENQSGLLGTDKLSSYNTPIKIPISDVKSVAAGDGFLLVLKSDGSVYGLGSQSGGKLGNDNYGNTIEPIKVEALENIVDIASGSGHSLALHQDGSVSVFGMNYYGQLGGKGIDGSEEPVKASLPKPAQAICASDRNSAVILEDDTIMLCGDGDLIGMEDVEDRYNEWRQLVL